MNNGLTVKVFRSVLWRLFCLAGVLFFSGCDLVDETYGVIGRKSVNGIDVFYSLLAGEGREVKRSAYISSAALEDVDLIVHFEDLPFLSDRIAYIEEIEAWMRGEPYFNKRGNERHPLDEFLKDNEREEEEEEKENREDKDEKDDFSEITRWNQVFALYRQNDNLDEYAGEDEEEGQEEDAKDEGEKGEPDRRAWETERPRTLLYFIRDADNSLHFWDLVVSQMKDYPEELAYCEERRLQTLNYRQKSPGPGPILLGESKVAYPVGELKKDLIYSGADFSMEIPAYPVRTIPDRVFLRENGKTPPYKNILKTSRGEVLIRRFDFKNVRLILVYNAEAYLNFALARKEYRRWASGLIEYALQVARQDISQEDKEKNRALKILLVEESLREAVSQANKENVFRILTVFPINVIFIHLALFLALYLYSRWPHLQRPLGLPPEGSREFIEHIRSLGKKIARSRERIGALKSLLRLKHSEQDINLDPEEFLRPLAGESEQETEARVLERVKNLWPKEDEGIGPS